MENIPEQSLITQGSSKKFMFTFLISFVISKMIGIAFTKIFTNVLTQEEMGEYTIILSALALIMSFAAIGFPSAINRYAIRYKTKDLLEDLKDFLTTGFLSFIVMELFIVVGLIIWVQRSKNRDLIENK